MTIDELVTDLKAAGANDNTIRLAMNCYELGETTGWNSAIESCAFRLQHDFVKSFGADTLSSIAAYMKGFKR